MRLVPPKPVPTLRRSAILVIELVFDDGAAGVGGSEFGADEVVEADIEVEIAGGASRSRRFNEECFGGEGARVDVECAPFVKRREIDVVVVDVLVTGATGGERGGRMRVRDRARSAREERDTSVLSLYVIFGSMSVEVIVVSFA